MTVMTEALTFEESQALVAQDEQLVEALRKVDSVVFPDMFRQKLMTEQGWTSEQYEEAVDLYRKFLALNIRFPEKKICPTGPVDALWHAHIVDTRAYAGDCYALFGGMLHHYPYFGMCGDREDLETSFTDSIDLFIRHFGVDPTAGDSMARSCRPQRCP